MKLAIAVSKKIASQNPVVGYFLKKAGELGFSFDFCGEYDIPKADFTVIFGGDGTMLHFAKLAKSPVIAVNMGRVGFLSQISPGQKDIEQKLMRLKNNDFSLAERTMLTAQSGGDSYTALNDIVFTGADRSKSVTLEVALGGDKYILLGDGVIVSTPTGSTAYCLATGGPSITAGSAVFAIVPLACHRPAVIFPDSAALVLRKVSGDFSLYVDGVIRRFDGESVSLTKAQETKAFVVFEDNFFEKLERKLSGGF